jgi:hypothetical protein
MAADESIDLSFPVAGTMLVGEFGEQPALTTISGVNVRAQDPFEQRRRGGSRRGTSKLLPDRANGNHPIQCLDFVVTTDPSATLFALDQSVEGPGIRIADPSSSNFPDGPGPTGPGGNAQGGPFGPPGFNRRQPVVPNTVRQGGNGVMRQRTAPPVSPPDVPPPPPPPSPPGSLTRTYTPFDSVHNTENVGIFRIGPVAVPHASPVDLTGDVSAVDFFGSAWNIDLSAVVTTTLPTLAAINALFVAAGWADGGTPGGPYESSADS